MIKNIRNRNIETNRILKKKVCIIKSSIFIWTEKQKIVLQQIKGIIDIEGIIDNYKFETENEFMNVRVISPKSFLADKLKVCYCYFFLCKTNNNQLLSWAEYDKDFEVIYLNTNFRIGDNFGAFIKVIVTYAFKGYSIFRNLCNKYLSVVMMVLSYALMKAWEILI